jgi:hypothetical protein
MVPKQSELTAAQAEELLQIILSIITDFLRTGNPEKVFAPVTLLNASRLLPVPQDAQDLRPYAALGMLHWIRYQRLTESAADFDAAYVLFTNVYTIDLRVLPDGLREQFAQERPARQPAWELWNAHGRVLVDEFVRDHGERLLDRGILLYRMSLAAIPATYEHRAAMEYNLGVALSERFRALKERDDLDAAIAALQRATQAVSDAHPNRDHIWSALGDAVARRFESTRALADAEAAVTAYRVVLPLNEPVDDAGRQRWFSLGSALWSLFGLTRSADTLAEAINVFRAVADQAPRNHPLRPGFLSALSGALLERYEIGGNLDDLSAALRVAEDAVAEAPPEYAHRAALADNVTAIRERLARPAGTPSTKRQDSVPVRIGPELFGKLPLHVAPVRVGPEFFAKLRPYVAPVEALPLEVVEGAPEILPGIVVAVAVQDGSEVTLLTASSGVEIVRAAFPEAAEQGLKLLRQLSIENLHRLPFPHVQTFVTGEGAANSDLFIAEAEDRFVASRITFLDDLADWAAPGRPRAHGILVAIPRRRTVLLHFPSGPGVLDAFKVMQVTAGNLFNETPYSKLSPHVYYVAPDGRREIVISPTEGGAFMHLLYGRDGLLR